MWVMHHKTFLAFLRRERDARLLSRDLGSVSLFPSLIRKELGVSENTGPFKGSFKGVRTIRAPLRDL